MISSYISSHYLVATVTLPSSAREISVRIFASLIALMASSSRSERSSYRPLNYRNLILPGHITGKENLTSILAKQ